MKVADPNPRQLMLAVVIAVHAEADAVDRFERGDPSRLQVAEREDHGWVIAGDQLGRVQRGRLVREGQDPRLTPRHPNGQMAKRLADGLRGRSSGFRVGKLGMEL
jgi:hypothetical protein